MQILSEAEKVSCNQHSNLVDRNAGSDIDDNRVDFVQDKSDVNNDGHWYIR